MWKASLLLLFFASCFTFNFDLLDPEIFGTSTEWDLKFSDPVMIVSKTAALPPEVQIQPSNNCLGWIKHENTIFLGWRTGPYHFASSSTRIYIISSEDEGKTWNFETEIYSGRDMREPYFLSINGNLFFYFFEAGTNPIAFQPHSMQRMKYISKGKWTEKEAWAQIGEIAWQYNMKDGEAYTVSYVGSHYSIQEKENIRLYLNKTKDGINWEPVGGTEKPYVYQGGISEVGWYFDLDGDIWAVGRNEDGDQSGWGRRVAHASSSNLAEWTFIGKESNPSIIESPRMFRHANDLYLVGRTDPDGKFEQHNIVEDVLPNSIHHLIDLVSYSFRRHGDAIWKVQTDGTLQKVADLPGCGDTAFPSILRVGEHKYWIANYSSPFAECKEWSWLHGQLSADGTQIHYIEVEFVPKS